jgi:putative transposase
LGQCCCVSQKSGLVPQFWSISDVKMLTTESGLKGEDQMKKSAYTAEQITYALRQVEAGTPVAEVCRKLGISEQTFYRWQRKFAGMGVAELRRLRQLEEENRKLK